MLVLNEFQNPLSAAEIERDYKMAKIWRGAIQDIPTFFSIAESGVKLYNKLTKAFNELDDDFKGIPQDREIPDYLTQFLEFSLSGKVLAPNNWLTACAGEGYTLANDTQWIYNADYNIKKCTILAGPYMMRNSERRTNQSSGSDWYNESNNSIADLFDRLLTKKDIELEVYSNIFPPLHNGFLGLFHFYSCNGAIMVEEFHSYAAHNHGTSTTKFMLKDINLANEAEQFAREYILRFANKVKSEELLLNHYNTSEQDDYFNFYNHEFIEELKLQYAE